jgi:hypothetical protein
MKQFNKGNGLAILSTCTFGQGLFIAHYQCTKSSRRRETIFNKVPELPKLADLFGALNESGEGNVF